MIIIDYCKHGKAVSDFDSSDWICEVKKTKHNRTFQVSTSLPVDLVRLAIVSDEINCKDVTFLYCGDYFQANEYGAIENWPTGFCDGQIAVIEDILRRAIEKKKIVKSPCKHCKAYDLFVTSYDFCPHCGRKLWSPRAKV
jgi:hypothetical protein